MKKLNRIGHYTLCTALAFPVFIAFVSLGILITYSDSALLFLLGN